MTSRALTYLLLLLMTLQSTAGLADTHSAHQSGTEHVSFEEHQHSDDREHHIALAKNTENQNPDCHHCCHCHGHFSPATLISAQHISLTKSTSPVPDYSEKALPDTYETFLRPPIA